eukprot:396964-Rhodomonas_salina.2
MPGDALGEEEEEGRQEHGGVEHQHRVPHQQLLPPPDVQVLQTAHPPSHCQGLKQPVPVRVECCERASVSPHGTPMPPRAATAWLLCMVRDGIWG